MGCIWENFCMILYYFLSLIHHPTQELNLNLMFIAEKPKLSELSLPLQWCFKSDWNILTGQKLKEKEKSESGDQIAPTFTFFFKAHKSYYNGKKTISGSSSSCFLPPLLLHCPQVPPILKPDGLLISPNDPREEW